MVIKSIADCEDLFFLKINQKVRLERRLCKCGLFKSLFGFCNHKLSSITFRRVD